MSESLRHTIAALLARFPVEAPDAPDVVKAGILPLARGASTQNTRALVMKPRGARPELGPPPWQLAKGTRMHRVGGAWADMRAGDRAEHAEPLPVTALREGVEELGLNLASVQGLRSAGLVRFTSASTGAEKPLFLLVAECDADAPLLAPAASTAERAWIGWEEFEHTGRADHVAVAQSILAGAHPSS